MKTVSGVQDHGSRRKQTSGKTSQHAAHGIVTVDELKSFLFQKRLQLLKRFQIPTDTRRTFLNEKGMGDDPVFRKKIFLMIIYRMFKIRRIMNLISQLLQQKNLIHFKLRHEAADRGDYQCFFHSFVLTHPVLFL